VKVRQNLYIDREINSALDVLAAGQHGNKSRLVNAALADWLERRGSRRLDEAVKLRLDRLTKDSGLIRRDLEVLLESLSQFILYQLTVTAPLAEADAAGRAIGRDRFETFIAEVGRNIAASHERRPHAEEPQT
jgi:predicted transcriptional regulator